MKLNTRKQGSQEQLTQCIQVVSKTVFDSLRSEQKPDFLSANFILSSEKESPSLSSRNESIFAKFSQRPSKKLAVSRTSKPLEGELSKESSRDGFRTKYKGNNVRNETYQWKSTFARRSQSSSQFAKPQFTRSTRLAESAQQRPTAFTTPTSPKASHLLAEGS